jgi:RNA polymerase sigma factor (TIGR02999 family)
MPDPERDVTRILRRAAAGDAGAAERLWELTYDEVHGIAQRLLRSERRDHTLSPTGLVHEAYLRLVDQRSVAWGDRKHFFALAARMCRRVLVDHARRRAALRRGGDRERAPLDTHLAERLDGGDGLDPEELLALDEALDHLGRLNRRLAEVVEMRYFGGLTEEEIAAALEVTPRTVRRDWVKARAFLYDALYGEDEGGAGDGRNAAGAGEGGEPRGAAGSAYGGDGRDA